MSTEKIETPPTVRWVERNVGWLIPVLIMTLFFSITGVGLGILSFFYAAEKKTDVYQLVWNKVEHHAVIKEKLGEPLKAGWSISGKINFAGLKGDADFSFPVKGIKEEGTVHVVATREEGKWFFKTLDVKRGNEIIDLISGEQNALKE